MYENQNQSNRRGHIAAIIMALIIGILGTMWNLNNQKLRDSETVVPSPAIGTGLTVHFIDVGEGDSILLTCGKQTMLVDAGSETAGDDVVDYLRAQGVAKIDYLVSTHPHRDHCGGLAEVVQNYPVKTAYSPVTESDNEYFSNFASAAAKAKLDITVPAADDTFTLGDATVTVLGPRGDYESLDNVNNMSLVLRVDYGATAFLLTGDMEYAEETALLDAGCDVGCNVLKAGHHGSEDSTGYRLLSAAGPDTCVISCGEGNDYGHPHDRLLSRLEDAGVEILRTDQNGTVVCVSDGSTVTTGYERAPEG